MQKMTLSLLSLLLLLNISAHAMQKEFLTQEQVSELKELLQHDAEKVEKLRRNDRRINCAARASHFLQLYHGNSGVSDPVKLLQPLESQALEGYMLTDDVMAMYEGMIWAADIQAVVMRDEKIKELEKEAKEKIEKDPFVGITFIAQYAMKAAKELEKNEKEKVVVQLLQEQEGSTHSENTQKAYYRYLLTPQSAGAQWASHYAMMNSRIKKLFAWHTSYVLGLHNENFKEFFVTNDCDVESDYKASDDDANSSDYETYELSDEE